MIKFLRSQICIILIFLGYELDSYSIEQSASLPVDKPYTFSICATFKDEASYLKEWIEYHLLVGVDHFFLYNVGSTDNFLKTLSPYIKKNIVTLVNWYNWNQNREENAHEWALAVQIPAYENALKLLALEKTKWMIFLDIHEFLVSPTEYKIPDLLKEYDAYCGIMLNSDCYDASRNKYLLPPRKLLIQTAELTKPLLQNPQKEVTKIIFKPDHCQGFTWPPYRCIFKNLQVPQTIKKSKLHINHYLNREGSPPFHTKRERLFIDSLSMTDEEMNHIFSLDYEIEELNPEMQRFIPELAKKLGYDLGWGF
jgi:hypothetical protein